MKLLTFYYLTKPVSVFDPKTLNNFFNINHDYYSADPSGVSHPIHLHGYGFQVIDMGTREEYDSNNTPYYYDTHPPNVKDTIVIPSGGFARIRFRASNPGYWLFHCHFEW